MTRRTTAPAYPQLEAFFSGYLHQDFPEVHGNLAGAVRAFANDARPSERRALAREWRAFRAEASGKATVTAMKAMLASRFGSAWAPRRRAEIDEFDRLINALDPR